MCKCVRLYRNDVLGIELAKSEKGKWYHRSWINTGLGYQWSRWDELKTLASVERHAIQFQNMNGNEITEHNLKFDFGLGNIFYYRLSDKRSVNGSRYRLPN
jgi:hypothetical protein